MKQVAEDFRIPLAEERWFAVRWWPARWEQIQHGARWLLGGSAVLWAAAGVAWAIRRCIGAVGTQ